MIPNVPTERSKIKQDDIRTVAMAGYRECLGISLPG